LGTRREAEHVRTSQRRPGTEAKAEARLRAQERQKERQGRKRQEGKELEHLRRWDDIGISFERSDKGMDIGEGEGG